MTAITSPAASSANGVNGWTLAELTAARKKLMDEIARLRQSIVDEENDSGPLARQTFADGEDEIYVGTLFADMGAGSRLADNSHAILRQCETALQRIGQLRYGICDECDQPIVKDRLLAMPRATRCTHCQ